MCNQGECSKVSKTGDAKRLTDEFMKVFPIEDIEKKIHDEVKRKTESATEEIEVSESRKSTVPLIWNYCFEEIFFHEAVRYEYLKTFRSIRTMFSDYHYPMESTIRVLNTISELSSNKSGWIDKEAANRIPETFSDFKAYLTKHIIFYMSELPDRVVSNLIERYMRVTESSDKFYLSVLEIAQTK